MILDGAVARDIDEGLRRELQYVGHDADIHGQLAQCRGCLLAFERRKLEQFQAALFSGRAQRIGLNAGLFRCAKHRGDLVAPRQECLEHAGAEGLLPDQCDFHRLSGPC
jgi:hypothetical protein